VDLPPFDVTACVSCSSCPGDEARHALVDAIPVYSAKGDLASLDRAERFLLTSQ